jgi:hypothetical protein
MAEIADSRPEPGPLTLISTSRTPLRSAATEHRCAACWAAKGVLLREPLKPTQPPELAQIVSPSKSVIVINVLLNVAFMCTTALTTFLLTLRFTPFAIIIKTSNNETAVSIQNTSIFIAIPLHPFYLRLSFLALCAFEHCFACTGHGPAGPSCGECRGNRLCRADGLCSEKPVFEAGRR